MALAVAILGAGWINLDRTPDAPAAKPEIAGNAMPVAKPRTGPRIVQRSATTPAETLPAPPKPEQAARNDLSAAKPLAPTPSLITPVSEAQDPALAGARMARLAAASRYETQRGDPVTGALIALEALPGNIDGPQSPDLPAVHRAFYAAHFARREIAVLSGHFRFIRTTEFSPDGTRIVTASWGDRTARLWNAENGAQIAVLRGHVNWVNAANFNPDGRRLATASGDGTVRLWDAVDGALVAVLGGHAGYVYSAKFSPDGKLLVTASGDGTARIWNALGPTAMTALPSGTALKPASRIAASPDGGRLVTASADGAVRLWDGAGAVQIAVLRRRNGGIISAQFSPEGDRIAIRSDDGVTRRYTIFPTLGKLAAHLKTTLPRQLSRQQRRQNFLPRQP